MYNLAFAGHMKSLVTCALALLAGVWSSAGASVPSEGIASWYGETHRGRLMANGKKFNPDRFTAASWFFPLGTKVKVTLQTRAEPKSVFVTITDRGPAYDLVREGRIIDLAHAAFRRLADPGEGLIPISVQIVALPSS